MAERMVHITKCTKCGLSLFPMHPPLCKCPRKPCAECKSLKAEANRQCEWTKDETHDYYDTACGEGWTFTDGNVTENGCKFCPYCGGKIKETR